jgi:Na+/citrate or Na+/malate symporter
MSELFSSGAPESAHQTLRALTPARARMRNALVILLAALLASLKTTASEVSGDAEAADARQLAQAVGNSLERGHYTQRKLDADTSARILEAYLGLLDPEKLFFTRQDLYRERPVWPRVG